MCFVVRRFETQQEMNRQLERQLEILKDKIQQHNGCNKKGMVVLQNFEEMTDVIFVLLLNILFTFSRRLVCGSSVDWGISHCLSLVKFSLVAHICFKIA